MFLMMKVKYVDSKLMLLMKFIDR